MTLIALNGGETLRRGMFSSRIFEMLENTLLYGTQRAHNVHAKLRCVFVFERDQNAVTSKFRASKNMKKHGANVKCIFKKCA